MKMREELVVSSSVRRMTCVCVCVLGGEWRGVRVSVRSTLAEARGGEQRRAAVQDRHKRPPGSMAARSWEAADRTVPGHAPAAQPMEWRPWRAGAQTSWPCCAACWSPACIQTRQVLGSGPVWVGEECRQHQMRVPQRQRPPARGALAQAASGTCCSQPAHTLFTTRTHVVHNPHTCCSQHAHTCGSAGTAARSILRSSRRTRDGTCRTAPPAESSTCGGHKRGGGTQG